MVISEPNPYVLCPLCIQVNYLKLDGGDGLFAGACDEFQVAVAKALRVNLPFGNAWEYVRSVLAASAPSTTTATPAGIYQFDDQGRVSSSPGLTLSVGARTIVIDAGSGLVLVQ